MSKTSTIGSAASSMKRKNSIWHALPYIAPLPHADSAPIGQSRRTRTTRTHVRVRMADRGRTQRDHAGVGGLPENHHAGVECA